jgi:UDP-glucose 4-epimerase
MVIKSLANTAKINITEQNEQTYALHAVVIESMIMAASQYLFHGTEEPLEYVTANILKTTAATLLERIQADHVEFISSI